MDQGIRGEGKVVGRKIGGGRYQSAGRKIGVRWEGCRERWRDQAAGRKIGGGGCDQVGWTKDGDEEWYTFANDRKS